MRTVIDFVRGIGRRTPAHRGAALRAEFALAEREAARAQRSQPYTFDGWINR